MQKISETFKELPELKTLVLSLFLAITTFVLMASGLSNISVIMLYLFTAIILCIFHLLIGIFKKKSIKEFIKINNVYFVSISVLTLLLIICIIKG